MLTGCFESSLVIPLELWQTMKKRVHYSFSHVVGHSLSPSCQVWSYSYFYVLCYTNEILYLNKSVPISLAMSFCSLHSLTVSIQCGLTCFSSCCQSVFFLQKSNLVKKLNKLRLSVFFQSPLTVSIHHDHNHPMTITIPWTWLYTRTVFHIVAFVVRNVVLFSHI